LVDRHFTPGESLQIHTGAEDPVFGPSEDDDSDTGVLRGLVQSLREKVHGGYVDGVARLRPVEGEDVDRSFTVAQYGICHDGSFG
jgi:hypothetical protein